MLRLLAVLPGQIDHKLSGGFVVASIDGLDIFLPGADRGLPLLLLLTGRRGGGSWMRVGSLALGAVRCCGVRGGSSTLLGLGGCPSILQNLVLAAYRLEVFVENLRRVLPGTSETSSVGHTLQ